MGSFSSKEQADGGGLDASFESHPSTILDDGGGFVTNTYDSPLLRRKSFISVVDSALHSEPQPLDLGDTQATKFAPADVEADLLRNDIVPAVFKWEHGGERVNISDVINFFL